MHTVKEALSIVEVECWGKRAEWCDYYGEVGGHTFGIAAFDHPDNPDFPTHWHVRDPPKVILSSMQA